MFEKVIAKKLMIRSIIQINMQAAPLTCTSALARVYVLVRRNSYEFQQTKI